MTRSPLLRASAPPREIFFPLGAIAFVLATITQGALSAEPAVTLVTENGIPVAIEGTGLSTREERASFNTLPPNDAEWHALLSIYVVPPTPDPNLPAMLGEYRFSGVAVRFTPKYPFRPGLTYRAVLHASGGKPLVKEFPIPAAPRGEPTRVVAIYPTAAVLPENQLRFYIHFSAPMARGEAFDHIQLLGADGKPDTRAFFEITGEELWDASQQRLTILFDPGRVKKGLSPHLEHGPILHQGKKYTLAIDKAWLDAAGHPLAAPFAKNFTAGPPLETAIDHKQWRILPPIAGTRDPLAIEFPRPLDHALLRRTITIHTKADAPISGDVTITQRERRFEFLPDSRWSQGSYSLLIDTVLEDTAGNRLNRPFEVDVFDRIDKNLAPETVRVPFTIQ